MKKKIYLTTTAAFISQLLLAQDHIEMADTMRSNGKIYVVVAVLCVLFAVITAYIISVDRKVTRLEKNKMK
ncbi:MAG: CcmD family protein [Bacteroidota bacterium]